MKNNFAENLKLLCSYAHSVSKICRDLEINRHQFSKYLNGTSQPSNRNLRKICTYFDVTHSDLVLPHDQFLNSDPILKRDNVNDETTQDIEFNTAFHNQTAKMKKFLGAYLVYYYSDISPDKVICALTVMSRKNDIIVTKTLERFHNPKDNSVFLSKYTGQATLLDNRIFIVEFQSLAKDAIIETILYPMNRKVLNIMQGTTFGISSMRRHGYMTQTVWKHLGIDADLREALKQVGMWDKNSRHIDPNVIKLLGEPNTIGGRPQFE